MVTWTLQEQVAFAGKTLYQAPASLILAVFFCSLPDFVYCLLLDTETTCLPVLQRKINGGSER